MKSLGLRDCSVERMTERDQEALQKGFKALGDNIDKLYARPLQKVCVMDGL